MIFYQLRRHGPRGSRRLPPSVHYVPQEPRIEVGFSAYGIEAERLTGLQNLHEAAVG